MAAIRADFELIRRIVAEPPPEPVTAGEEQLGLF